MPAPRYQERNTTGTGSPFNDRPFAQTAAPNVPVATGAGGYIDPSFMPPGINADIVQAYPTEAIAAGALVNLFTTTISSNPATGVRNADAATSGGGKKCDGFTLVGATAASTTTTISVYRSGADGNQSGLTPGADYYLGNAGAPTATVPPATSGTTAQYVGRAISATLLDVQPGPASAVI